MVVLLLTPWAVAQCLAPELRFWGSGLPDWALMHMSSGVTLPAQQASNGVSRHQCELSVGISYAASSAAGRGCQAILTLSPAMAVGTF